MLDILPVAASPPGSPSLSPIKASFPTVSKSRSFHLDVLGELAQGPTQGVLPGAWLLWSLSQLSQLWGRGPYETPPGHPSLKLSPSLPSGRLRVGLEQPGKGLPGGQLGLNSLDACPGIL